MNLDQKMIPKITSQEGMNPSGSLETFGLGERKKPPVVINEAILRPEDRETLKDLGIEPGQKIDPEELRQKGFAMINSVGQGERRIFPDLPLLITQEELDNKRKDIIPEGITPEELREISSDMEKFIDLCLQLSLIHEDLNPRSSVSRRLLNISIAIRNELLPPGENIPRTEIKKIIEDVLTTVRNQYKDQIPDEIRGIPIRQIERRKEGQGVEGSHSPILEDEEILGINRGIIIHTEGEKPHPIRLNSVVAHLTQHGVCNEGQTTDSTQQYFSLRQYLPIFEQRFTDPEEIPDQNEILKTVSTQFVQELISQQGYDLPPQEVIEEYANSFFHWREEDPDLLSQMKKIDWKKTQKSTVAS